MARMLMTGALLLMVVAMSAIAQQTRRPNRYKLGLNLGCVGGSCGLNLSMRKYCTKLTETATLSWSPKSCSQNSAVLDANCTVVCSNGTQLVGSAHVQCSKDGWNGTGGLRVMPECLTPSGIGNHVVNQINQTIHGVPAGIMIVIDESWSLQPWQYVVEKNFSEAVLDAFPLSASRSAGVISFSTDVILRAHINNSDHCGIKSIIKGLPHARESTNMHGAMTLASQEVKSNKIHNLTLVLFITDGEWNVGGDPSAAAAALKDKDTILFTIGAGNYKRSQLEPMASFNKNGARLFYGIKDFTVFQAIADYLQTQRSSSAPIC